MSCESSDSVVNRCTFSIAESQSERQSPTEPTHEGPSSNSQRHAVEAQSPLRAWQSLYPYLAKTSAH
eukprot:2823629-Amphidinium_carterae.2